MDIIIGCATNRGNVREKNQDSIVALKGKLGKKELAVSCVCDGIGSFQNSEIAAKIMEDGISRWFEGILQFYPKDAENEEITSDLEITIRELNEVIYEYRQNRGEDIGCTMSVLLTIDMEYFVFHVGDSRIYCFRDIPIQITCDEVATKSVNGTIKKFLSNYVGKKTELWMNRLQGKIKEKDLFLLVSDGTYKKMKTEDLLLMKQINDDSNLQNECKNLLINIMERGEKDNLSCAVVRF